MLKTSMWSRCKCRMSLSKLSHPIKSSEPMTESRNNRASDKSLLQKRRLTCTSVRPNKISNSFRLPDYSNISFDLSFDLIIRSKRKSSTLVKQKGE